MSEIKYQDFALSKIGLGLAVVFSLFSYVSYYLWIYPALASVPLRQNVYSKTPIASPAFEDLSIQISAPLYLSNFQESLLIITIINDSADQVVEGKLNLNITGSNLLVNQNNIEKYVLPFLLDPKEVFTKNFAVKILNNEDTHVIFTVNFSQLMIHDEGQNIPTLQANMDYTVTPEYLMTPIVTSTPTLTETPDTSETVDQGEYSATQVWNGDYPVEWIMDGYEWQGNSKCKDEMNTPDSLKTKICAINYPYGSFAESSLSKLLLPPWSGFSLLVLIFAVVWMFESIILPEGLKKDTFPNFETVKYLLFLVISSTILLVFVTLGVIQIFKNINSQVTYFLVVAELLGFALCFAFFVSLLFEQKGKELLIFSLLSLAIFSLFIVFLIHSIEYYLFFVLFLIVPMAIAVVRWWNQKYLSTQNNNVDNEKEDEDKKIYEAYKNNNLRGLKDVIDSANHTSTQRQHAKRRLDQVGIYLQKRVEDWGEYLNSAQYDNLLQSVNILFEDSPNLELLPDPIGVLKPLLNNKEGVDFTDTSEWKFEQPSNAGNIIIQAVKSKLSETSATPDYDTTNLSASGNVDDRIDSSSTVTENGDNNSQQVVSSATPTKQGKKNNRKGNK